MNKRYWNPQPSWNRTERHADKSWTTIDGWNWNSKRLAHALIQEGKARGGWKYGITINAPLSADLASFHEAWLLVKDGFRRAGIAAHFQVEISPRNRWHVHGVCVQELAVFRRIWATVKPDGWKLRITRKLKSWKSWCRYIVKARGYEKKRCIWEQGLGIQKHNTINAPKFWTLTANQYWEEKIALENKLTEWSNTPGYFKLVREISEMTGHTKTQLRYLVDPNQDAFLTWKKNIEVKASDLPQPVQPLLCKAGDGGVNFPTTPASKFNDVFGDWYRRNEQQRPCFVGGPTANANVLENHRQCTSGDTFSDVGRNTTDRTFKLVHPPGEQRGYLYQELVYPLRE